MRVALETIDRTSEECALRRIHEAFNMAQMTIAAFTEQVGTSRSRMSIYLSGKIVPNSVIAEKMVMVGEARRDAISF